MQPSGLLRRKPSCTGYGGVYNGTSVINFAGVTDPQVVSLYAGGYVDVEPIVIGLGQANDGSVVYDGNPTRYGPLDQGVAYRVPPIPASINDNSGLATMIFEAYRWWSPSSGWTDWYWSWAPNVYDETLRTYNGQCFNPGTTF